MNYKNSSKWHLVFKLIGNYYVWDTYISCVSDRYGGRMYLNVRGSGKDIHELSHEIDECLGIRPSIHDHPKGGKFLVIVM